MLAATISVDLDPVDVHLAGYGHAAPFDPRVYDVALPRLLERFDRHGIRGTFFLLGRDAERASAAIASIVAAGHEVASHSFDHPPHLARLGDAALRDQLARSRHALEAQLGGAVRGFRAPDWSVGSRVIAALAAAGYWYDASLMPSPVLAVGRGVLAVRARRIGDLLGIRPPASLRRTPFVWRCGGALVEFPVTVTPGLRLPVYHTLRYSMGERRFLAALDAVARRGESLSYPLHGIDALGLREDGVDRRLAAHPGMARGLEDKLVLLDATLAAIAARFVPLPFRARLARDRDADEMGSTEASGDNPVSVVQAEVGRG
jgi:peptidoglycan-N-acetylglucosamine deacetylase